MHERSTTGEAARRRRARLGFLVAVLAAAAAACVDHEANAVRFCQRIGTILDDGTEAAGRSADEYRERADAIAEVMRFAEDGTREVREAGRATLIAYDDHVELIGDDRRSPAEIEDSHRAIVEARAELRAACGPWEVIGD